MSYTAGSVFPVHRLRAALRDTNTSAELLTDAQYEAWLRLALSTEQIQIRLPSGLGYTSALASVDTSGSNLVLNLKRGSENATPVTLAPSGEVVRVEDLIDAIRRLDQGWDVALVTNDVEREVFMESDDWVNALGSPILECLAKNARPVDLAFTYGGYVTAYDTRPAKLRFYCYGQAALSALGNIEQNLAAGRTIKRKKDGDMEREYADLETLRTTIGAQAGFGIYAEGI